MFPDITIAELNHILQQSWDAFHIYRKMSLKQRADFMQTIAIELGNSSEELIKTAMQETNLPEARLKIELTRTIFQLNSYAAFCESGQWMDIRIDTANPNRNPPKPDLRKMLIPLGPVAVFGASNFPFAYSTAGGDTACAFAAGCPVIVKAHPAHARTSELAAKAIFNAIEITSMPNGIFSHVHGASSAVGEALVKHPFIKAVGFTGSFAGGKQLFDWGNQRKEPIPVFAEMGSVNPIFLLQEKLALDITGIAKMIAASVTLNVGQFCTNPGIMIAIEGELLSDFINELKEEIKKVEPAKMLHQGIANNYREKKRTAILQENVQIIFSREEPMDELAGSPAITSTTAQQFIQNPLLQQEVFGPYSIIVQCKDMDEMIAVAKNMEGQLTTTLIATEKEIHENESLVEAIKNICGRFILNGVPTGVEVCLAMQHGGPFPATTDSRFSSVGADGIKRFARPISFQNWPGELLPAELKNDNPAGIWRTINNELTREKLV